MHASLAFALLLAAVVVCSEGFMGMGRPPFRPRGPPHFPFPACQEYMNQVEQKMRENRQNGEGGPRNCREGSMAECRFRDMMRARNQISEAPGQNCTQQINSFIEGSTPSQPSGQDSSE